MGPHAATCAITAAGAFGIVTVKQLPLPDLRPHGHRAAVRLDEALHHRQAEPGTLARPVGLAVGLEDPGQRVGGNADPGVLEVELEPVRVLGQARAHRAPGRREVQRVAEQIHDHAHQAALVPQHREVVALRGQVHPDPLLLGQRPELVDARG